MSGTLAGIDEPRTVIDGDEPETGTDIGGSAQPSPGSAQPERPTENLGGFDVFSPADATSTAGNTPRRRGRPPGSRNRTGGEFTGTGIDTKADRAKTPGDLTDLTKVLLSTHDMLAAITGADYVVIEQEQAKKLSNGIKEVGKYYSFNMSPKHVAIFDLAMIMLAIYGPMFVILFKGITKPAKKKGDLIEMPSPAKSPNAETAAPVAQPVPAKSKAATNPSEIWNDPPSLDLTAI